MFIADFSRFDAERPYRNAGVSVFRRFVANKSNFQVWMPCLLGYLGCARFDLF